VWMSDFMVILKVIKSCPQIVCVKGIKNLGVNGRSLTISIPCDARAPKTGL